MLDRAEARRRAENHLRTAASDLELVITAEEEFPVGWVFFYDSKIHHETGSDAFRLAGNAPILVARDTGEIVVTGTARPTQDYVADYSEQRRRSQEGWPQSLSPRLLALLGAVRDGQARRDARTLDLYVNARYRPEDHTVLEELQDLERRGLVERLPESEGGVGGRWALTAEGRAALKPDR